MQQTMNTEQVAELLHLHPDTVRRKARSKQIPVAAIIGGQFRFLESSIRAWMHQTRDSYHDHKAGH